MRLRLLLIIFALGVIGTASPEAQCRQLLLGVGRCAAAGGGTTLSTNLISYWELNEASGNALDSVGSNTMAETSSPNSIPTGTGIVSGARDFELGDTEWLEVASNASSQTGDIDFTICGWINLESLVTSPILSKYTNGAGSEYRFGYSATSSQFALTLRDAADTTFTTRADSNTGTPSTGAWYFSCGWHDSVNNLIGIQSGSAAGGVLNSSIITTSYTSGVFSGTEALRIGYSTSAVTADGLIDEVGFWKRVLTSAERTWLYNSGAGRSYAAVAAGCGC